MTHQKNIILFGNNFVLILKKEFDSESVCNKHFLKTKKQKSHGEEVTDFYDKKNSLGRF